MPPPRYTRPAILLHWSIAVLVLVQIALGFATDWTDRPQSDSLLGQHVLRDGGSITLTTGVAADDPVRGGGNAAAVNAAVEGFVKGAAIELARGQRINAVSPTLLTESVAAYGALFPGVETVPAARVALAYVRSVEGPLTGRVFRV